MTAEPRPELYGPDGRALLDLAPGNQAAAERDATARHIAEFQSFFTEPGDICHVKGSEPLLPQPGSAVLLQREPGSSWLVAIMKKEDAISVNSLGDVFIAVKTDPDEESDGADPKKGESYSLERVIAWGRKSAVGNTKSQHGHVAENTDRPAVEPLAMDLEEDTGITMSRDAAKLLKGPSLAKKAAVTAALTSVAVTGLDAATHPAQADTISFRYPGGTAIATLPPSGATMGPAPRPNPAKQAEQQRQRENELALKKFRTFYRDNEPLGGQTWDGGADVPEEALMPGNMILARGSATNPPKTAEILDVTSVPAGDGLYRRVVETKDLGSVPLADVMAIGRLVITNKQPAMTEVSPSPEQQEFPKPDTNGSKISGLPDLEPRELVNGKPTGPARPDFAPSDVDAPEKPPTATKPNVKSPFGAIGAELSSPEIPKHYIPLIQSASKVSGMPSTVIAAQLTQESGFQRDAISKAGAEGPAQFMPRTWDQYGEDKDGDGASPYDPEDAVDAQGRYMADLMGGAKGLNVEMGNNFTPEEIIRIALMGYNYGGGRVHAFIRQHGHVPGPEDAGRIFKFNGKLYRFPRETAEYAEKILAITRHYQEAEQATNAGADAVAPKEASRQGQQPDASPQTTNASALKPPVFDKPEQDAPTAEAVAGSPEQKYSDEVAKVKAALEEAHKNGGDLGQLNHIVAHSELFKAPDSSMPGTQDGPIRYLPPAGVLGLRYEFNHGPTSNTPDSERYGQQDLIALILYTAYEYEHDAYRAQHYPDSALRVGDLSARDGHVSHNGSQIDLTTVMRYDPENGHDSSDGPIMKFSSTDGNTITNPNYNPDFEYRFLEKILSTNIEGKPIVHRILFNLANTGHRVPEGVIPYPNHSHHLHIQMVDRYYGSGDNTLKNAAHGSRWSNAEQVKAAILERLAKQERQ